MPGLKEARVVGGRFGDRGRLGDDLELFLQLRVRGGTGFIQNRPGDFMVGPPCLPASAVGVDKSREDVAA